MPAPVGGLGPSRRPLHALAMGGVMAGIVLFSAIPRAAGQTITVGLRTVVQEGTGAPHKPLTQPFLVAPRDNPMISPPGFMSNRLLGLFDRGANLRDVAYAAAMASGGSYA